MVEERDGPEFPNKIKPKGSLTWDMNNKMLGTAIHPRHRTVSTICKEWDRTDSMLACKIKTHVDKLMPNKMHVHKTAVHMDAVAALVVKL